MPPPPYIAVLKQSAAIPADIRLDQEVQVAHEYFFFVFNVCHFKRVSFVL